jgi:3-methyladenine DNA glycosylase AlkD
MPPGATTPPGKAAADDAAAPTGDALPPGDTAPGDTAASDTAAADRALVDAVRAALREHADPARAPAMRVYMKSEMPYLGVTTPVLTRALRPVLAGARLPDAATWTATARALWREAAYREERYAAIALTGHRYYLPFQTPAALDLYDEMIVTGRWWDYVDDVAIRRVGPLLRAYPAVIRPIMLRWSREEDLWRRRTSIICQISSRADIDLGLLYSAVDANSAETDFFIRKAIGWALRQHARVDPDEVRRFVAARSDALSPLSRREALKHLGPL